MVLTGFAFELATNNYYKLQTYLSYSRPKPKRGNKREKKHIQPTKTPSGYGPIGSLLKAKSSRSPPGRGEADTAHR
jgi:hypothetical protein